MTAIGDKVFYYPAPTETGIPPDPDQPFLAFVCHVHAAPDAPAPATDATAPAPNGKPPKDKPPQLVNLAIFDHRGMHHGRQDVPILADGKGVRPCCATAAYTPPTLVLRAVDGVTKQDTPLLTSATAAWTMEDTGTKIMASWRGGRLQTTIKTVSSPTDVVLNVNVPSSQTDVTLKTEKAGKKPVVAPKETPAPAPTAPMFSTTAEPAQPTA